MPLRPRRRALRVLDTNRLSQAASRPGSDPRVWTMLGTVEEIGYDGGIVAAVRIIEGPLVGETPACEVASSLCAAGAFCGSPIAEGDIAVLVVPEGDANAMPVVVAFLHSPERMPAETVNGETISGIFRNTHILADPALGAEIELASVRLVAGKIELAAQEPTQAFVRGNDFVDALSAFLDACDSLASKVVTVGSAASVACVSVLTPLKPFFDPAVPTSLTGSLVQWRLDIKAFKSKLVDGVTLSTKIIGE